MIESLIIEILKKIQLSDLDGISFIELMKSIPSLNPNKRENWTKLRIILSALIEDNLIEEKYLIDGDKTVDYTLESKGSKLLGKLIKTS